MSLARKLAWPQARLSRVEQGKRSLTVPELLALSAAFSCPVSALFAGLEPETPLPGTAMPLLSPGFQSACRSEDVLLAQLARLGVRFLGGEPAPALVSLPADETVLAALNHMGDPRVFETLPALLLRHAAEVDWTKLASAAYALGLQNRLGMVLAAALRLKASAPGVEPRVWDTLRRLHDALAERKLDREEVVGSRPGSDAALRLLRERTPAWMAFWHGLGAGDLASFRRYLPR